MNVDHFIRIGTIRPTVLIAELDVGGSPPPIDDVTDTLRSVQHDMHDAWFIAELMALLTSGRKDHPSWAKAPLTRLSSEVMLWEHGELEATVGGASHAAPPRGRRREFPLEVPEEFDGALFARPVVVLKNAVHNNPAYLELFAYSAQPILTLFNFIWTLRLARRSRLDEEITKNRRRILRLGERILAEGDAAKIAAVAPIVVAALQSSARSDFPSLRVKLPGFEAAIGLPKDCPPDSAG